MSQDQREALGQSISMARVPIEPTSLLYRQDAEQLGPHWPHQDHPPERHHH